MRKPKFDTSMLISSLEADGVSRGDIARESGLHRSTITRLARGEFHKPSLEAVMRIERAGAALRTRNKKGVTE